MSKVDVLDPDGDTVKSNDYIYDGNRVKEQHIRFDFGGGLQLYFKLAFTYDNKGNVRKAAYLDYYPDSEEWEEAGETVISDYDDKPNLHALLESYPRIPLNSFSSNNPGKKVHYNEGGIMVETITNTYTYDTQADQ